MRFVRKDPSLSSCSSTTAVTHPLRDRGSGVGDPVHWIGSGAVSLESDRPRIARRAARRRHRTRDGRAADARAGSLAKRLPTRADVVQNRPEPTGGFRAHGPMALRPAVCTRQLLPAVGERQPERAHARRIDRDLRGRRPRHRGGRRRHRAHPARLRELPCRRSRAIASGSTRSPSTTTRSGSTTPTSTSTTTSGTPHSPSRATSTS